MRIRIHKILMFLLVNTIFLSSYSQNQFTLPPSPTASALGKFIDNPVSHFTGTPGISISLYEIKLREFTVPIKLGYNPQDIQVATVASNVGLGWSLQAGGVITRAVRNVHDDWRADQCDENEHYDLYEDNSVIHDVGPYCRWGYMYAISDGVPFVQSNPNNGAVWGYYGTTTFNLDLDAIYNSRGYTKLIQPEHRIIENFAYPLWGVVNVDGSEWSDDHNALAPILSAEANTMKMYTDLEPDIFYFNFIDYSGKFVFDVEHGAPKIKTIPYVNIKFSYQTDAKGRLVGFTATDDKGIIYTFQAVETSVASDRVPNLSSVKRLSTYNSSWWLTKITGPSGESLNFSYQDESLETFSDLISAGRYWDYENNLSQINNNYVSTKLVCYTKRLTSIYNDNVKVDLDATHSRQDLSAASNSKAITGLTVSSMSSGIPKRLKKIILDYDYFLSDENKNPFGYYQAHNGNKRLRLRSVQEYGELDSFALPKYKLEYNYYDQGAQYASYKKLPNLYSFNLDLWGYSNGANNITPVPSHHIYPDHFPRGDQRMYCVYPKNTYTGRHLTTVGGNRLPNQDYMDIGALTKITYPTGGYTSYLYEPHRFVMDQEEYVGGGLRINKIVKSDEQGSTTTYNYRYTKGATDPVSSGKIVALPMYGTLYESAALTNPDPNNAHMVGYGSEESVLKNRVSSFYSLSVAELGRTQGSNVGYTRVEESISSTNPNINNGKTTYRFSFPAAFAENNDLLNSACTEDANGICDGLYYTTRIHNFFMYGHSRTDARVEYFPESSLSFLTPPNPNYEWNRGLMLSKEYFSSTGLLTQKEEFKYANYYPANQTSPTSVYGIKLANFGCYTNWGYNYQSANYAFRVAKYELFTDVTKVLKEKKVTTFNNNDGTKSISNLTKYFYDGSSHCNVTREQLINSAGEIVTNQTKYVSDYLPFNLTPSLETLALMASKNLMATPIEKLMFKEKNGISQLIASEFNGFREESDLIVLDRKYNTDNLLPLSDFNVSKVQGGYLNMDNRYKEKIRVDAYDLKGNVMQTTKEGMSKDSYLWGYNGQYPIAIVRNAAFSDIAFTSFESNDFGNWVINNARAILGTAAVGDAYLAFPPTPGSISKSGLNPTKRYKVSMWFKTWDGFEPAGPFIKIPGVERNGWSYYEGEFTGQSSFTFSERDCDIDDIRIYPVEAQMTTYTYKPLVGRTSETDPSGRTIFYEYDGFQRLKCIKDEKGNILKSFEYNYKP